jgi:hypothetical protein
VHLDPIYTGRFRILDRDLEPLNLSELAAPDERTLVEILLKLEGRQKFLPG